MSAGVRVFCSYSHKDEQFRAELESHLSALKRSGAIYLWHDRKIVAGDTFEKSISAELDAAQIVVLLVSADFLASEYCFTKELAKAMEKHQDRTAKVVPVILRACDWQDTMLGPLQALPRDGHPVTSWRNRDEAWADVVRGVKDAVAKSRTHETLASTVADDRPSLKRHLVHAIDRIDRLFEQDAPIAGTPTGYRDLDVMVGGIEAGDVVIVAGRPSTGRTSLVTSIGGRWALKDRKDVVFVSLQHTGEQIATRLLAGVGKIEHTRLRTGQLDDDDWPKLTNAVGTVVEAPFFIEDDPIQTPEMIERLIENHVKARGQIGLLVIDPLEGISEFQGDCRFLRRLAKTIKVPIIATVAVSADVERRPNKRPLITDLPADLKLDQLADKILFLYRDEMYYPEAGERDTAELIVARNIHGPLGSVRLRFDSEHLVFRNVK